MDTRKRNKYEKLNYTKDNEAMCSRNSQNLQQKVKNADNRRFSQNQASKMAMDQMRIK